MAVVKGTNTHKLIHLMGKKWCFLLKAGPFVSVKVFDA